MGSILLEYASYLKDNFWSSSGENENEARQFVVASLLDYQGEQHWIIQTMKVFIDFLLFLKCIFPSLIRSRLQKR